MAKVVCLVPSQLLITVPVSECGPTEELAIAVIRENFFREVARLLNCEGAGMIRVCCDFAHAHHIQHALNTDN